MEAVTPLIEGGQYMCLLQTMVWLAHDACMHSWKNKYQDLTQLKIYRIY